MITRNKEGDAFIDFIEIEEKVIIRNPK